MQELKQEMYNIVTSKNHETYKRHLTPLESRLAESISDILIEEPLTVSTCKLLHGFETLIVISLRSTVPP